MVCDCCGNDGARTRYITRSYGKGTGLLIIENVPVICCPRCGESYLTAETLHEIERVKLHRRTMAKQKTVSVVTFARAG